MAVENQMLFSALNGPNQLMFFADRARPANKPVGARFKAEPILHIPLHQNTDIIMNLRTDQHKTLNRFVARFDGLCELVCNHILINDLLGKGEDTKFLRNHVNVDGLNGEKVKSSHILDISSIFRKMLVFLFGIYPDNIFSYSDQWKLVSQRSSSNEFATVNRGILHKGLGEIGEGETLKLEVLTKDGFTLQGHSLLLSKTGNNEYTFFDPNTGEHRNLSFDEICDKIDEQLEQWKAQDIYLTRGEDFLKRLKNA